MITAVLKIFLGQYAEEERDGQLLCRGGLTGGFNVQTAMTNDQ
jgi:hypothetical protein